ncbi:MULTISPECIES: DUF2987 domain-containing protein [unclassified Azospirillum]|uniref:DUF2987 domain-containing protein n=1 Tax=unclassified Azospirillum TaxID=2630922 RepID=UPI000B6C67DF|nr:MULTISPECIES: DUF2987 domain-containing protein [unclassified Azospirillum]SNS21602.1 Protein of unknown function [Azospirillum sp. RU38E]SNS39609.1 Protein of unknown function [Azospirillum sp. RU37A]
MRNPVLAALVLALPLLAGPAIAQTAVHQVPYKELFDQLDKFYSLKERDRLSLRTSIRAEDGKQLNLPVTISIASPDGVLDIPVDADNAFQLPYQPDWLKTNTLVQFNQSEKNYKIRVQVGMKLPADGSGFTYADVQAAFAQFDKLIGKEAGMLSFVAPSAQTLRVFCGVDCTATLAGPSGSRQIKADKDGRVMIANDKKLRRENPTITFSKPPAYTAISTKE